MSEPKCYQDMKLQLSKISNKKRLRQLKSWLDNEINHGKGHRRIKNAKGEWIKIKK